MDKFIEILKKVGIFVAGIFLTIFGLRSRTNRRIEEKEKEVKKLEKEIADIMENVEDREEKLEKLEEKIAESKLEDEELREVLEKEKEKTDKIRNGDYEKSNHNADSASELLDDILNRN